MAKTRNILNGFKVEMAKAKRKCHSSKKHQIQAGEQHLAIYVGIERQNICKACALPIFAVAQDHLDKIRQELL